MISNSTKGSGRAPDPRPARTRAAILAAIEQLGSNGRDISVSAVVAEAGLSRSSFYSQFKDLGDVAVQLLRELNDRPEVADLSPDGAGNSPSEIISGTHALLREMQDRRHLYSAVLGSGAAITTQWEVCDVLAHGALRYIGGVVPSHIEPLFAARYIVSGYLANILEWLTSEHPVPLEEFEVQLRDMLPSWIASEIS